MLAGTSLKLLPFPSPVGVSTHSLWRARALVEIGLFTVAESIADDDVSVLPSQFLVVVADAEAEPDSQDGEYWHTVV